MTDAVATHPPLERPLATSGHRVGEDPLPALYLMEDHDEALRIWQRDRFSGRTLLHIDAHIDFDWIPERTPSDLLRLSSLREVEQLARQKIYWDFSGRGPDAHVHIGNYICLAIHEGIVSSFFWVTPEAPVGIPWEKEMLGLFREFERHHPDVFTNLRVEKKKAGARVYGLPLSVYPLSNLPPIEEEVLLDIDTDFLISGFLEQKEDPARKRPWLFPEGLIEALRDKGIRSNCVTIAYSVEGGFTPLPYKYLGDALADLLRNPSSPMNAYLLKRSAQALEEKGKTEEATEEYQRALKINPKDAASLYNLSLLFLKEGEKTEASRLYQEAALADPSYATAYNTLGPVYQESGRWEKAEEEYKKALVLDPHQASALCGLADCFRVQKDTQTAIGYYQEALSNDPKHAGAFYGLGRLFFEKKEWERALESFQRSLELKGPEAALRFWIGATLSKVKKFPEAKGSLLEAARLGYHSIPLHGYLFWIYLREGLRHKMGREFKKLLWLVVLKVKTDLERTLPHAQAH